MPVELIFLLIGFIVGFLIVIGLSLHYGRKAAMKKKKEEAEEFVDQFEDMVRKIKGQLSIQERLTKVKEITARQLELRAQSDGPLKSSLHGKYRNSLINEMKSLEQEKNDILRSILKDGLDPELSVMDEVGGTTTMKLSEYMAYIDLYADEPKSKTRSNVFNQKQEKPDLTVHEGERLTDIDRASRDRSKFTVHEGGKGKNLEEDTTK